MGHSKSTNATGCIIGAMELRPACVVLTGPMGAGKTSTLRSVMAILAAEGRCIRAIVQPADARREEGKSTGFSMELLSGTEGLLTSRHERLARELATGEEPAKGELRFGRFAFNKTAFLVAEEFIHAAVDGSPRVKVIGIDEIGRLELDSGGGLAGCLDMAMLEAKRPGGPCLILSVREDCVQRFRRKTDSSGLETMFIEKLEANACLSRIHALLTIYSPHKEQ